MSKFVNIYMEYGIYINLLLKIIQIFIVSMWTKKVNERMINAQIENVSSYTKKLRNLFGITLILNLQVLAYFFLTVLVVLNIVLIATTKNGVSKVLENPKSRKIKGKNYEMYIKDEHIKDVVNATYSLASKNIGSSFIVARESELDDIIESGIPMGESEISQELLESLFSPYSYMNKGAVVIKDDKIVAANCKMPVVNHEQIINIGGGHRHLGMFGTIYENDCIVIGSSKDTGTITIGGPTADDSLNFNMMQELLDKNVSKGISRDTFYERFKELLIKTDSAESSLLDKQEELKQDVRDDMARKERKRKKTKEEKLAERQKRAEENERIRQQKMQEREKRKRKR